MNMNHVTPVGSRTPDLVKVIDMRLEAFGLSAMTVISGVVIINLEKVQYPPGSGPSEFTRNTHNDHNLPHTHCPLPTLTMFQYS